MNKTKYIKIRVSEAELSKLKRLAEKNGLTVSAYIRYLVAREWNGDYCTRDELKKRLFGVETNESI